MDAQQQAERLGHHSANREARPCRVPWAASLRPLQEAIDIGERMRDAARAKRAAVAASASLRPQAGRGDGARAEGQGSLLLTAARSVLSVIASPPTFCR